MDVIDAPIPVAEICETTEKHDKTTDNEIKTSISEPKTTDDDVGTVREPPNTLQLLVGMLGFQESTADEDGFYSGMILPPDQAAFLWGLSWLSLLAGILAITRAYYDLAAVPLGVWVTSLNYWRKPILGWRRMVDMAYVNFALIYQLYRAYTAENAVLYYTIVAVAVCCYPLSVYAVKYSSWAATLIHGFVHILGNISNIILYSGNVHRWW